MITEVLEMQLRINSAIKKLNDISMTPCHHFQIQKIMTWYHLFLFSSFNYST